MRHAAALLTLALLPACSMQGAVERIAGEERSAELVGIATQLCADPTRLEARFDPALWTDIQGKLPLIARECPAQGEAFRLAGYRVSSQQNFGEPRRVDEEATLVAGTAAPWTTVELVRRREGRDPLRITGWHIEKSTEEPEIVRADRIWDQVRLWGGIGLASAVALLIGLIVWIIRRGNRRYRARHESVDG